MSDERRTQRRVEAAIPVQVRGTDAQGEAFEESAEALDVSRRGLSILTRRDLPLYANLSVTIPGRGPTRPGEGPSDFFSQATVVRVEKEGELSRVGIRFIGATLPMYTSESD
jgi:hypothetical protein